MTIATNDFLLLLASVARIIPPNAEYQKSIEFLKSLGGAHQQDEELDHIKAEHDEKIKRFKSEASVFYKGLEDLKQATTVQVKQ